MSVIAVVVCLLELSTHVAEITSSSFAIGKHHRMTHRVSMHFIADILSIFLTLAPPCFITLRPMLWKTHSATVASARNFLANWFIFEDGVNKST